MTAITHAGPAGSTPEDRPSPGGRTAPGAVLRPLGPTERWYWMADRVSPYNGIGRIRIEGPLHADSVARALRRAQRRHPLLRAAVRADRRGRPVWVDVPDRSAPLRTGTLTDPGAQWIAEIEQRESCEPVDLAAGPPFRAALLSSPDGLTHDLLLVVSHVAVDASTMMWLLRDCVETAARFEEGDAPEQAVRSLSLRPAVEDLIPRNRRPHRPAELVRTAGSMLREQRRIRERAPVRITGQERVPFHERRSGLVHHAVSAGPLERLLEEGRRRGATVHGALSAALVQAVAEHGAVLFGPEVQPGADKSLRITLGSPVDLRSRLSPRVAPDEVGPFVSMLRTNVDQHPGRDFWETARAVTQDLRDRRREGEEWCLLHLSRWMVPRVPRRTQRMLEAVEAGNPQNLALSNFGRIDFPRTAGSLRFSDAQLAASLGASCYLGATVVTTHGSLNLNLNYLRRAVPEETARSVAARWHQIVEEQAARARTAE